MERERKYKRMFLGFVFVFFFVPADEKYSLCLSTSHLTDL